MEEQQTPTSEQQPTEIPTPPDPTIPQTPETTPHKHHKKALAAILVVFLLIIGGAVAVLLANNDDDNEEDTLPTVSNQAEPDATEATSLVSSYLDSYSIEDTSFGTVVTVTVDEAAGTRTIERNALPNHNTGDFPNDGNPNEISAQNFSETYTLNPTNTGEARTARTVGIAINGVKFEPDTAERAVCDGDVVHSIEAIQDITDLGLDFNNAHVQPTGEYHYHGVSDLLVDLYDSEQDLVHVGFAADGNLMYYSKSGAYKPSYQLGQDDREGSNCSYTVPGPSGGDTILFDSTKDGSLKSDWDYDSSLGDLDECNGIEVNGQYVYLITDEYPYIGRCLFGEFSEEPLGGGSEAPGQQDQQSQGTPTSPSNGAPPSGQGPPQ